MHGDFIWYELMTSDADAAQDFYGPLLDWTFVDSGQAGMDYRVIHSGEDGIGGTLNITSDMAEHGARPCWIGYIAVNSVDDMAASIARHGGKTLMPATDVPDVGRIAMVTDPQGAPFYIMTPLREGGEGQSKAFNRTDPIPGRCSWNELVTSDQSAAWHFYTQHFGWVKDGSMDMGPMGTYDFIRHEVVLGAMMTGTAEMGPPHWNFYMRVADIDAAKATIEARGGQVIHGPQEIPGGEYAMNAIDPQGAHFALVGKREGHGL